MVGTLFQEPVGHFDVQWLPILPWCLPMHCDGEQNERRDDVLANLEAQSPSSSANKLFFFLNTYYTTAYSAAKFRLCVLRNALARVADCIVVDGR